MPVTIKSDAEIAVMREAGRINAEVRRALLAAIRPGVTGLELDRLAREVMERHGAQPTFVGYAPGGKPAYPGAICFSVNEELVHGIPSERRLEEGDIVSIDVGVTYRGYVADAAFTAPVGEVSEAAQELMRVTQESLWKGIEQARPGNRIGDISYAIGSHANGYGVIREYGGHGVGRRMHEEPHVLNYGRRGTGLKLKPGMVLALEPMLSAGDFTTKELSDRWTVVMRDGSLSAHFEETVAITEGEPEVLTRMD